MLEQTSSPITKSAKPILMLVVLWLVGWTLRVPILAAPPLAVEIGNSFGLGEAGIGALTMLPIIAVALGAIPAAWIISRCSLRSVIAGGVLVMALASAARGFVPNASLLFMCSMIMGLAVAVFQTALPSATRHWTPRHVALGSAVYLNGMMLGETSGAGLTLPLIMPLAGDNWAVALLLWSLPLILIAALVAFVPMAEDAGHVDEKEAEVTQGQVTLPRINDMRVWQYGLLLASSVVAFYVINAYCASILAARGENDVLQWVILAFNAMPLLASFVLLARPNWIGRRAPLGMAAIAAAMGLLGFILSAGWLSWLSALVCGFAATIELILLISLPPSIAKGIAVTRLSAGMSVLGFSLAFVCTLLGGYLADRFGVVELALWPALLFMLAALLVLGKQAVYPPYP
ncbi:MAG: MFS transporter [Gammaproteobacteria bacterium]|nr:MFS transporter [Gammaproteobacteria bacterium]